MINPQFNLIPASVLLRQSDISASINTRSNKYAVIFTHKCLARREIIINN